MWEEHAMQKITPFLWFDGQAEEAASFYTSLFKDSRVVGVSRFSEALAAASGMPPGAAMTVTFELAGQQFTALNGGPQFKFTEAVSFFVSCESQAEVDYFWERLSEGGEEQPCGWLKDRYGLSWQIIPTVLMEMLQDEDGARSQRTVQALLQMKKIDISALQRAYEG
jgi:predicted 3-demethylubiquinone-9 3-methyltransferase (glyoxalase superfamily)